MNNVDYIRQSGLIPEEWVGVTPVTVIGAGGIGAITTLVLAKMGFGRAQATTVWDPDKVEAHNVPTQLYGPGDVGKSKVGALKGIVHRATGISISGMELMWAPPVQDGIYICGVDTLRARAQIWEILRKNPPKLYIDARMGALVADIYVVTPDFVKSYEKTLEGEPVQESCTARATFFTGAGIAAAIGSIAFRHIRRERIPFQTLIHWGTLEIAR